MDWKILILRSVARDFIDLGVLKVAIQSLIVSVTSKMPAIDARKTIEYLAGVYYERIKVNKSDYK